jgi:hypothetical protein
MSLAFWPIMAEFQNRNIPFMQALQEGCDALSNLLTPLALDLFVEHSSGPSSGSAHGQTIDAKSRSESAQNDLQLDYNDQ